MNPILQNMIVSIYLLLSGEKRLDKQVETYKRLWRIVILMALFILTMMVVCFLLVPTELHSTPLA